MMVFGVVNLIYSVHNNEQGKDYRSEKLAAKKKMSKTLELKTPVSKTMTKTVKKTAKKTAKKA